MAEPTYVEGEELRKWVKQHLSRNLFQTAHELACQTKCEIIIKIRDGQNVQDSHYYATKTLETAFCNGGIRKEQWDINVSGDSFTKSESNAIPLKIVSTTSLSSNESGEIFNENISGISSQVDNSSDDNEMPSVRRHPFGIIPRKQQQSQRMINQQDTNQVAVQNLVTPVSKHPGIQITKTNPNCAVVHVVPKQQKTQQISQVRTINAQGTPILVGNTSGGTGSPTVVPIQQFNNLKKGGQMFIMQKVGNTNVLTPVAVQQTQSATPTPAGMVSPTHQQPEKEHKRLIRPNNNPPESSNAVATGGFSGRPFKCGVCYKTFGSVQVLSRHSQTFHEMVPNKRFFCDMCGKNYKHPQHLQQHMATHNSTAPYKCTQCHRGFYRMGTLKDHELLHLGMYRYYCPECRKGFMRPSLLQDHINRFHTATVTPSAPVEDNDGLSGNMMQNYTPQVGQDGDDQGGNLQDNEQDDATVANQSTDDTNQDNLNGITIKQERLSPTELDLESQTQETQQDGDQGNLTQPGSDSLGQLPTMVPMSSPQGKSATKTGGFTSVKPSRQAGTANRRYSCDICGKTYKYVFHMREHRLTHSGQHPFVCKICNTGFFRQRQLREHQFRHSGSFPYTCEKCNKGFFRPSELRRHQSVKHGIVVHTLNNTM